MVAERCGYVSLGAGRWARDRMTLLEHKQPPRTGGYVDLARGAEVMTIAGTPIRVASLIDLIRILEGDGYSNLRPFGAALWATLEMVRRRERDAQPQAARVAWWFARARSERTRHRLERCPRAWSAASRRWPR